MTNVDQLRARLSDRAVRKLDLEDIDGSPFSRLCSVVKSCLLAGLDEADAQLVFESSPLVEEFRESDGRLRAERHFASAWGYVEENDLTVAKSPEEVTAEIRDRLAGLHTRIRYHRFPGRASQVDRKVALWIVERCHELGAYSPLLGVRTVAEEAGVSLSTASKSLKRLEDQGFHRRIGQGSSGAHRYRINLDWLKDNVAVMDRMYLDEDRVSKVEQGKGTPGDLSTCSSMDIQGRHPVFLGAAMGPVAGRLYFEIPVDQEVTIKELVDRLGVSRQTVDRALRRLVDDGVYRRIDGRPAKFVNVGVPIEYLDSLAVQYGTADWGARMREEHERNRAGFAEHQRQREEWERQWAEVVRREVVRPLPEIRSRRSSISVVRKIASVSTRPAKKLEPTDEDWEYAGRRRIEQQQFMTRSAS